VLSKQKKPLSKSLRGVAKHEAMKAEPSQQGQSKVDYQQLFAAKKSNTTKSEITKNMSSSKSIEKKNIETDSKEM